MEFRLAREMEALGADVQLRRRNLQNLLSSLTSYEMREVARDIFTSLDFRTDILSRLPPELRLHVAQYVDKIDITSFLNVSKTWRTIWSQSSVVRILMPDFWEYHRQREETDSSRQDLQILFSNVGRRHRIRSLGKYRSLLTETALFWFPDGNFDVHSEDDVLSEEHRRFPWAENELNMPRSRNFLYHDGRVVWQPRVDRYNNGFIIVDELRTQVRKVYTIPGAVMFGGEGPDLQAVGSQLVVARHYRILHAWDLETNRHCSVTLPSPTSGCKTYGKEVYTYSTLLSKDGSVPRLEIYVWKFQQNVRALDTRPLLEAMGQPTGNSAPWYCLGIIAHPLLEETIFVVCQQGHHIVSIHKYTGGVYRSGQSFTAPETGWGPIQRGLSERLTPVNGYGSFAVAVFGRDVSRGGMTNWRDWRHTFRVVCFDTLRELFSVEEYTVPMRAVTDMGDCTWWTSRVVLFVREVELFEGEEVGFTMVDKAGPTDIPPSPADDNESTGPLYRDGMSHLTHITLPKSVLEELPVGCRYLTEERQEMRRWETVRQDGQWPQHPQLLWADDSFIVLCISHVRATGYIVLSTDTTFRKRTKKGWQPVFTSNLDMCLRRGYFEK